MMSEAGVARLDETTSDSFVLTLKNGIKSWRHI